MKKAVILFNLGGPDKLENVEPFLFNLFNDPAILNLPTILRYPLAKLISNRRSPNRSKDIPGAWWIISYFKINRGAIESS
jgi:ferrochelatase